VRYPVAPSVAGRATIPLVTTNLRAGSVSAGVLSARCATTIHSHHATFIHAVGLVQHYGGLALLRFGGTRRTWFGLRLYSRLSSHTLHVRCSFTGWCSCSLLVARATLCTGVLYDAPRIPAPCCSGFAGRLYLPTLRRVPLPPNLARTRFRLRRGNRRDSIPRVRLRGRAPAHALPARRMRTFATHYAFHRACVVAPSTTTYILRHSRRGDRFYAASRRLRTWRRTWIISGCSAATGTLARCVGSVSMRSAGLYA